jgi:hypothetical protein
MALPMQEPLYREMIKITLIHSLNPQPQSTASIHSLGIESRVQLDCPGQETFCYGDQHVAEQPLSNFAIAG